MEKERSSSDPTASPFEERCRRLARRARDGIVRSDAWVCEVGRRGWLRGRRAARWLLTGRAEPTRAATSPDPDRRYDAIVTALCEVDRVLRADRAATRRLERIRRQGAPLADLEHGGLEALRARSNDLIGLRRRLVQAEAETRAQCEQEAAEGSPSADSRARTSATWMDLGRGLTERFDDLAAEIERRGRRLFGAVAARRNRA